MEFLKLENEWMWMEIRDSYFYIKYKPNKPINIEIARQIIADAVAFANGKTYPVLTDIREMAPHGHDVRDYFAKEASNTAIANAIIISSSLSSILANIFLTLNKPTIPTRIFTDSKKAAKWLEMFPVKARTVLV